MLSKLFFKLLLKFDINIL